MKFSRAHLAAALIVVPLVSAVACVNGTDAQVSIGNDCENGFCAPDAQTFATPPDSDGGDAEASALTPLLACKGTECPAPYATCGSAPSFLCQTNLMNDSANCGACGHTCEGFDGLNILSRCVNGECAYECITRQIPRTDITIVFRDCNGMIDDGCESNASADPKNCGACGNVCADGQRCIGGQCGCPGGKTDCFGNCVDTRFDDGNCGTCGTQCEFEPEAGCHPLLQNTFYGCAVGQCGQLKCVSGYSDCNYDLTKGCAVSDGCETDTSTDRNNCGACGVKCGADQECRNDENGSHCVDTCAKGGLTECADGCHDIVRDPLNCGACGNACASPGAHQKASCSKGFCKLDCLPGFDDCNGDPTDGCEVDLSAHPANCGACGNACDFGIGQPCINGKCLMVECDAGATK